MYHPGIPQTQPPRAQAQPPRREHYQLFIRQEPEKSRVVLKDKEKDRKSVDPPPIIQLQVYNESDPNRHFLHNPYLFMCCALEEDPDQPKKSAKESRDSKLLGTVTSSLHRLKDPSNGAVEGGFFVFGDLSCQTTGRHYLRFSLHEFDPATNQTIFLTEVRSASFEVLSPRDWEGPTESTILSRAFVDQGVRLRLRKEPRTGARRQLLTRPQMPMGGQGPPTPLAPHNQHANSFGSQSSQDPEGTTQDEPDAKRRRTFHDNNYQAQYPSQPPSTHAYSQPSSNAYSYSMPQRYAQYPGVQDPSGYSYPAYNGGYSTTPTGAYQRPSPQQQQQQSQQQQPPANYPPGYTGSPSSQVPPQYQYPQGYSQYGYPTYQDPYNNQYRQPGPASYGPYNPSQPSQSTPTGQPAPESAGTATGPSSTQLPPMRLRDADAAVPSVEQEQSSDRSSVAAVPQANNMNQY